MRAVDDDGALALHAVEQVAGAVVALLGGVEAHDQERGVRRKAGGSFTVLQHLGDEDLAAVAAELKRVVGRPGAILLCEEVDPAHQWRAVPPDPRFTIGRAVEVYEGVMAPCRLTGCWPRRIEPRGPEHMPSSGAFMLFARD